MNKIAMCLSQEDALVLFRLLSEYKNMVHCGALTSIKVQQDQEVST